MGDAAPVTRRVAGDTGWNGHLERCALALADDLDLLCNAVRHHDGAAQRDLLFREPSDDRITQVERRVCNRRIENARQVDSLLGKIGSELVAAQRHGREDARQLENVELAPLEGQPTRLLLFHHADFDDAHLRHLLAAHRRDDRLVARIVAGREIPDEFAKRGVCFQRDLRRRHPRFQHVRPGSHRMRRHFAWIRFDDLMRDRDERRQRHDAGECVVAALETDAQRMALNRLESGDLRAVVEFCVGFGRRRGSLVETDDLFRDVEGVRRSGRRIDETLDRVDVIVGRQLAPLPLECGIVREHDSRLDPECVRFAVVGDLRQRRRGERNNLGGPREIIESQQRFHDRGDHRGGIDFARHRRIEAGFGTRQRDAQDFGRVRGFGEAAREQDQRCQPSDGGARDATMHGGPSRWK